MNSKNITSAINIFAVSYTKYNSTILGWKVAHLDTIEQITRNLIKTSPYKRYLTFNDYIPRREVGKGGYYV